MSEEVDQACGYYGTRLSHLPGRDGVWRAICHRLRRYIPNDAVVLDLGAGYCSFINHVQAAEKHALDLFPGCADHAAQDVKAHVGDARDLSRFADCSFGVVFASNLLEHLAHDDVNRTVREMYRILRPGGRLLLIQPNYRYCSSEYFDDYTHRTVFSHLSLTDLVASVGFRVDEVVARFMPLTLKSRLPQWPWIVALYLRLPYRPLAKQMLVVASRD